MDGAVFADARGGYFILDIDSAQEYQELLGDVVDLARVESHPLVSFEDLAAFFEKQASA